jgi:hypothetical protein
MLGICEPLPLSSATNSWITSMKKGRKMAVGAEWECRIGWFLYRQSTEHSSEQMNRWALPEFQECFGRNFISAPAHVSVITVCYIVFLKPTFPLRLDYFIWVILQNEVPFIIFFISQNLCHHDRETIIFCWE